MIRLLLADDHTIFRHGLRRLLEDEPGLSVVAEAADGSEVLDLLGKCPIDVALLDLSMPGKDGVDLIADVKSQHPTVRILVVTMHGEARYVTASLSAGADGYMTKDSAAADVIYAIRRVAGGGRYVCSVAVERLANPVDSRAKDEDLRACLTGRELMVFEMLVSGKRGSEIAAKLEISEKTVSVHKSNVLRKMNMTNRTELLRYAIKHHLVAA